VGIRGEARTSVWGQTRKSRSVLHSSALTPKADLSRRDREVRLVPPPDLVYRSNCLLFDHFVGELLELQRNFEVKRLRGL
jgi:hypothetical protein